jgi:cytochrome c-type biogenesis protein CcmH/NrfG
VSDTTERTETPLSDEAAEERDFLLRSLDDLDREHSAGNVDDDTYARLHADYTARAAIALRSMREGADDRDEPDGDGAPAGRHRLLVIGGLVVFAVVVAVSLAFALGARLPGNTVTGRQVNSNGVTNAERERRLEAATKARPRDAQAQLALARFRLGRQDLVGALTAYQAAAALAPTDAEPFAYSGWIIRLQGYPDQALQLLDKAVQVDGTYPDAHFFRGFVLLRDKKDPEAAIPDFQQYLVSSPDSPLADQVRSLLAEAVESGKPSPSPSP